MTSFKTGRMFVRDIDHLDAALFCPEAGIIGATWHVDVELEGMLDANGFVFDFGLVKKKFKETLKKSLDHALLLPKLSEQVSYRDGKNDIELTMKTFSAETWTYQCPPAAVYFINSKVVDGSSIAAALEHEMAVHLPQNVVQFKVSLREEFIQEGSVFRYTHGLPGHEGACQRLFHGHRSKIEIYENGIRNFQIEKIVSEELFHNRIHILSPGQIISGNLKKFQTGSYGDMIEVSYTSSEGRFEGSIPANRCLLFENSTSIESISQNLINYILNHSSIKPQGSLMVRCFEGINKGGEAIIALS